MSFDSIAAAAARKVGKNDKPDKIDVTGYGLYDVATNSLIGNICAEPEDLTIMYEEDYYAEIGDRDCLTMLKAIMKGEVLVKKFSLAEIK